VGVDSSSLEAETSSGGDSLVNWGISKSQVAVMAVFVAIMSVPVWRIFTVRPALPIQVTKPVFEPDEDIIPKLDVENLNVAFSTGGMKERVLHFARARQRARPEGPVYEVEKPRVIMARVEDATFSLEADEGWFNPKTGDWWLAGDVHAASGTQREFYSDSARYYADRDLIVARGEKQPLRLIDQGIDIQARELRTDSEFQEINLDSAGGTMGSDYVPPIGGQKKP